MKALEKRCCRGVSASLSFGGRWRNVGASIWQGAAGLGALRTAVGSTEAGTSASGRGSAVAAVAGRLQPVLDSGFNAPVLPCINFYSDGNFIEFTNRNFCGSARVHSPWRRWGRVRKCDGVFQGTRVLPPYQGDDGPGRDCVPVWQIAGPAPCLAAGHAGRRFAMRALPALL